MRRNRASLAMVLFLLFAAGIVYAQTSSPLDSVARRIEAFSARKQTVGKTAVDTEELFGERFTFTTGALTGCDWSPDGRWITYEESGDIYIAPTGGGSPVNLTADMAGFCYLPVFAPDNSGVLYTVYDSEAARLYVNFSDITGLMSVEILDSAMGGVVSHNGRYTVYRDFVSSDLRIYDNQTQSTKTLMSDKLWDSEVAGFGMACFPPDDSHVIASVVVDGRQRLFRFSLDGTEKTQLTFNGGDHDYPDISSDGRWLLFSDMTWTDIQVNRQLARELSTGRTAPVFPNTDVNAYMGRFSPAGDELCYLLDVADESYEVYIAGFNPPEPGVQNEIVMVPIPGGTFQMGSDRFTTSKPIHTVTLSPFEMSETEITQGQYETIMNANPSTYKGDLTRPVETVNWQEAVSFCNRLSISQGLQPCYDLDTWACDYTQNGYRLPTEAEWEYACRAGTNTRFYSGDTENDLAAVAWYKGNSGGTHHPVARKAPNSFGLFDMHGNVQELVNDWWSDYTSDSVKDPTGPITGPYAINRGGYFDHEPLYLDSTIRNSGFDRVAAKGPQMGFRVVRREAQTPATVNLISPNGGEILIAGTSHYIAWTSSGISLVKLEYSTDSGATWKPIADNIQASVEGFSWEVPATATTTALVRITDVSSSTTVTQPVTDRSDTVFTITVPYLRVVAPNGGETWEVGKDYRITWEARDVQRVTIELSRDNGVSWSVIATGVDAPTRTFTWTPGPPVSDQCRIRITDEATGVVNSASYAKFSIVPAPFIKVTAPNGGEVFQPGDQVTITWDFYEIDKFRILYSTEIGTWIPIVENLDINILLTTGSFDWTVPDVSSSTCRIRVADAAGTGILDMSDNNFTIQRTADERSITVLSPNGGEEWVAGETYDITWRATGLDQVGIWYTDNDGQDWYNIIAGTSAVQGSYPWTIPSAMDIAECYIAVADPDDLDMVDYSDEPFSITQAVLMGTVYVNAPGGGEVLVGGREYIIKWEALNVQNVDIFFTIDGGSQHLELIAGNVGAWQGRYTWTVPSGSSYSSSNCYLIFTDSSTDEPIGANLSAFTISQEAGDPIQIYYPAAGTEIDAGVQTEINWFAVNTITFVTIQFSTNGGANWTQIGTRVDASTGRMLWSVPTDAVSDNCIVRVINADNVSVMAVSEPFRVLPDPRNINASFVLDTDFRQEGAQNRIVTGIGPNGLVGFAAYSREWQTSNTFTVLLKWDSAKAVYRKGLTLLSMTGQTMTVNGTTAPLPTENNILATDGATANYTIRREESGLFEAVVSRSAIGMSRLSDAFLYAGFFETSAQFGSGDSLVVRVDVSVTDKLGNIRQLDSRFFRVYAAPDEKTLALTAPNGGETWNIGSSQTIKWTSAGVGDLKIEFSADGGSTWSVIKDRVDATSGQYLWPIPDMTVSSSCLVRVSDADNPTVTDTGDAAFSVARQAFIQVTSPAEGDAWVEDSTHAITWIASSVDKVDIEYTTNGGVSWVIAATNVSASDGMYQWRLPQTESSNCSVRIFETNNQALGASSGVFSILTSDYITVSAPAGGDSWSVNTQKEIRWEGRGVSNVRIEISYDGGYSWTDIIADNVNAYAGYYMWTVADNQSDQCKIKVSDVSRADVVTFTTDTFRIVSPDISIIHSPRTNARENEAIVFEASVSATADIQSVVLNYNKMGQSEGVVSIPMQREDDNRWTYSLGAGFFIAPGIEYYIIATDVSGMTARSPVDVGVHSINARVVDMRSTQAVSGGSEQTSYRMISIPLNLSATSIAAQMQQTLPTGVMKNDWRLFRYPPGSTEPVEYPDTEAFAPGRAFWIITKNSFTLKAPEGTTVSTEEPFQMTLKSGWNDIANPWMFNINWSNIENRSSAQLSALYTYNGSWSDPTSPPSVLEPWKGYAVRNMESSDRIVFLRTGDMMAKPSSPVIADTWRASIRVSAGEALDFANHFGVRMDASEEWDRNDHVEPPTVGGYVSVSFPHHEWSVFPYEYTVDYRPPAETLSWDFVVRTNIPDETVDVGFDGLSQLPEGAVLTLIDRDNDGTIGLSGAGFSFVSGDGVTERHYTLVVSGDNSLPPGQLSEEPSEFITAAAFPNPFNPQTTLRYEMPSAGTVHISIYNTLGQLVRSYDLGHVQAGVHEQVFDAVGLTSGLYIYRIDAGYSAVTGKVLYMK